jgi:hypothetical protein
MCCFTLAADMRKWLALKTVDHPKPIMEARDLYFLGETEAMLE